MLRSPTPAEKVGLSIAVATGLYGISFGALSVAAGLSFWQTVALFNPVVYLISGFRWSFYGSADVSLATSLGVTLAILMVCMGIVAWIFKTGYRLRQ